LPKSGRPDEKMGSHILDRKHATGTFITDDLPLDALSGCSTWKNKTERAISPGAVRVSGEGWFPTRKKQPSHIGEIIKILKHRKKTHVHCKEVCDFNSLSAAEKASKEPAINASRTGPRSGDACPES